MRVKQRRIRLGALFHDPTEKESTAGVSCTSPLPACQHICLQPSAFAFAFSRGRLAVEIKRNCGGWEIGAEQEKGTFESHKLKVLFSK
jgi:hypothetical protein